MWMTLLSLVVFLTILTILVAAHEYGHYLFARLFKMGVEEFAIGFGRPYWVYRRKKYKTDQVDENGNFVEETTEYTIRPLPLGGFVRIKGMVPEEDGSETSIPGGFFSKPPWQRFVAFFAGPLFSVLAGWIILIPTYAITGEWKPTNAPVVGNIAEDSPASRIGLKEGDKIISFDGKPVASFYSLVETVRDMPVREVPLSYERDGKRFDATITPEHDGKKTPVLDENLESTGEMKAQTKLGIGPDMVRVPVSFPAAVQKAVSIPFEMIGGIFHMFAAPATIKDQVGGPVAIFQMTRETIGDGLSTVISFAGVLSIMLGVFNLLPVIGVLDGGHMCIAIVEMLRRGKRLSFRVQNTIAGIGLVTILFIFVSVMYIDISRNLKHKKEASEKPAVTKPSDDKSEPSAIPAK